MHTRVLAHNTEAGRINRHRSASLEIVRRCREQTRRNRERRAGHLVPIFGDSHEVVNPCRHASKDSAPQSSTRTTKRGRVPGRYGCWRNELFVPLMQTLTQLAVNRVGSTSHHSNVFNPSANHLTK